MEHKPPTGPITRRKLGHEVQERLLAEIRNGAFAVGTLLPSERELMQQFGVGRPAVREGLQALERMGLISILHGEGARVLALSADSVISTIADAAVHLLSANNGLLEHLKEARIAFEVGMARAASARAGEADLAVLRDALEAHRASLDDPARFLETDLTFHRAIASVSGNPVYIAVSQAMLAWLQRFHEDQLRAPGAEHQTLNEHVKLFDCISRGDADGAEQAVKNHLLRANHHYKNDS